jgi:hypothetical protein
MSNLEMQNVLNEIAGGNVPEDGQDVQYVFSCARAVVDLALSGSITHALLATKLSDLNEVLNAGMLTSPGNTARTLSSEIQKVEKYARQYTASQSVQNPADVMTADFANLLHELRSMSATLDAAAGPMPRISRQFGVVPGGLFLV